MTHTTSEISPELLAKALGSVMRAYRKRMGLTQERLGNDYRFDRMMIRTLEYGRRNPTMANIAKYLAAFGVGWSEFGRDLDRALHEQQERR